MAVTYQTEGVKMPDIKKRETTEWIKTVAASYGKRLGEIAYIFCSDEKILEVNRQYLQHDYYTDIITFDYCEGNERLSQHPQCLILSCFHNFPFSGTFIINAAQMTNSVENHTM